MISPSIYDNWKMRIFLKSFILRTKLVHNHDRQNYLFLKRGRKDGPFAMKPFKHYKERRINSCSNLHMRKQGMKIEEIPPCV